MIITIIRRPRREVKGFFYILCICSARFFHKQIKFEVDKAVRNRYNNPAVLEGNGRDASVLELVDRHV